VTFLQDQEGVHF